MKATIFTATLTFSLAYGQGSLEGWAPGGADDFRGPCPMMNTLANHGFLPHDGRNITRENAIHTLNTGLAFDTTLAGIMWDQAVFSNPKPNAIFFTLDNLNQHNVLGHDASLSRQDAFFGNNHVFNQTIFDATTALWGGTTLDANMLAMGKLARQVASKAFNPEYKFTSTTEAFSLGELAAPILMFGDHAAATVDRAMVEFFFENERLPSDLGWTKQTNGIDLEIVLKMSEIIGNAANLIAHTKPATHASSRRLGRGGMKIQMRDLYSGAFSVQG
ncbi:Peroxidase, family 2-domain-containing protein [Amylocarpus encephaloides]|uniref:Peroxidase, family 2-domain-containing protein n=1 Tax=Amylocarpus encephaloides TaxID=45428 RepID=A0A9P7YCF8_9HELO|nr:Peroxidase, family 2-domain-containing protein [Amylocarpus encephaloides]